MKKGVVYTAIIGKYDELPENDFISKDLDYICFSDNYFESDLWDVKLINPIYEEPTRDARKFKALPHRYLKNYEYSVWVDGNMKIKSDFTKLFNNNIFQTYDHTQCFDVRNCIYQEALAIYSLGNESMRVTPQKGTNNWKDNPLIIQKQIERYKKEGFPTNFGLAETSVVIRKHNDPSCIKLDEDWWLEMKHGSRRDQLSLNYVEWKNNTKINYIQGDVRNNQYFEMVPGHKGKK